MGTSVEKPARDKDLLGEVAVIVIGGPEQPVGKSVHWSRRNS